MSKYTNKYNKTRQQYMRRTWYSNRAFTLKDSNADIKTTEIDKLLLESTKFFGVPSTNTTVIFSLLIGFVKLDNSIIEKMFLNSFIMSY